jgi:hypothetical protein
MILARLIGMSRGSAVLIIRSYTQTQWLRRNFVSVITYSNLLQEYNIDIYFEREPYYGQLSRRN